MTENYTVGLDFGQLTDMVLQGILEKFNYYMQPP